jgi:hypothetical protein
MSYIIEDGYYEAKETVFATTVNEVVKKHYERAAELAAKGEVMKFIFKGNSANYGYDAQAEKAIIISEPQDISGFYAGNDLDIEAEAEKDACGDLGTQDAEAWEESADSTEGDDTAERGVDDKREKLSFKKWEDVVVFLEGKIADEVAAVKAGFEKEIAAIKAESDAKVAAAEAETATLRAEMEAIRELLGRLNNAVNANQ